MFFIIKHQSFANKHYNFRILHMRSSLNGAKIFAFVQIEIELFQNMKNIYCGSKS